MRDRKTYKELASFISFEERFDYLKIANNVCEETFGGYRYLNQVLYKSIDWKRVRREVILRDNGCDLGHEDYPINGYVYIHHINPITIDNIINRDYCIFDLNNLISSSFRTHNAIHYGKGDLITGKPIIRTENDTCLWRN